MPTDYGEAMPISLRFARPAVVILGEEWFGQECWIVIRRNTGQVILGVVVFATFVTLAWLIIFPAPPKAV
jgi:hypothetical protein